MSAREETESVGLPARPNPWTRDIPQVGTLTSDGTLCLSVSCATACGHHLLEGAEVDERARAAREGVRNAAQRAADELGISVVVTGSWDGRSIWRVHVSRPSANASALR